MGIKIAMFSLFCMQKLLKRNSTEGLIERSAGGLGLEDCFGLFCFRLNTLN